METILRRSLSGTQQMMRFEKVKNKKDSPTAPFELPKNLSLILLSILIIINLIYSSIFLLIPVLFVTLSLISSEQESVEIEHRKYINDYQLGN